MKHKKNKRKLHVIPILLIIAIVLGAFGTYMWMKKESSTSPQPTSTAEPEKQETITGEIVDATSSTFTIRVNEIDYTFERDATMLNNQPLILGDEVTITYVGTLQTSLNVQQVEMKSN